MDEQYCPGLCEAKPFIMTWYVPPDKEPGQCTYCEHCINKLEIDTTDWFKVESSNAFCDNKKSFKGRSVEKDGIRLSLKKRNSHYRYPVTDNIFTVDPFTHFTVLIENLDYYDQHIDLAGENIIDVVGQSFFSIDAMLIDHHDIMFHVDELDLYKQFLSKFEVDPNCEKILYPTYKSVNDHMLFFIPLLNGKHKTDWNKYTIKVSKWTMSENTDNLYNYVIDCFSPCLLRNTHLIKTKEVMFEFSLTTDLTDAEKYKLFIEEPFHFSNIYDIMNINFNNLMMILDKTKTLLQKDYEHLKQKLNHEMDRNFKILTQFQAEIDKIYTKYGDTYDHDYMIEI